MSAPHTHPSGDSLSGLPLFLAGTALISLALYLLAKALQITPSLHANMELFSVNFHGNHSVTAAAMLLTLGLGISMICYNRRAVLGWAMAAIAAALLAFGVLTNVDLTQAVVSAGEIAIIAVLGVSGAAAIILGLR